MHFLVDELAEFGENYNYGKRRMIRN